jgi:hypothetical protein
MENGATNGAVKLVGHRPKVRKFVVALEETAERRLTSSIGIWPSLPK